MKRLIDTITRKYLPMRNVTTAVIPQHVRVTAETTKIMTEFEEMNVESVDGSETKNILFVFSFCVYKIMVIGH